MFLAEIPATFSRLFFRPTGIAIYSAASSSARISLKCFLVTGKTFPQLTGEARQ
jgi:hypothetical protein